MRNSFSSKKEFQNLGGYWRMFVFYTKPDEETIGRSYS
jgi:hypothetical protein